jgi:hypothetical protein
LKVTPLVVAALAVALAPSAAAAQSKQACVDAYTQGQLARKSGKLKDARAKFQACAAASCPATLRRDCVPWSDEVEKDLGALTIRVVDAGGQPIDAAHVTLDGDAVKDPGERARVDPGDHLVRAEADGFVAGETRLTLAARGEREVVVKLTRVGPATPPPPVEAPSRPIPTLSIVLATAGLVGVGTFAALGAIGNGKKTDLEAQFCKPNCPQSSVDAIKTDYIGADVALAAGGASLAVAAVLFFTRPAAQPDAAPSARFTPTLAPTTRGATAGAVLRF